MREIKFRVWDKTNKRMGWVVSIDYFHELSGNLLYRLFYYDLDEDVEDWANNCITGYEGILMQYTGLKDKNGKEIYEGDVVSDGKIKSKVFWGKYSLRLYHINTVKTSHPGSEWMPFRFEGDYEVIGNIYENPEL